MRIAAALINPVGPAPEAETVKPPVALGNKGGTITLVDANGLKVDGVAYTKDAASAEGWTIVF